MPDYAVTAEVDLSAGNFIVLLTYRARPLTLISSRGSLSQRKNSGAAHADTILASEANDFGQGGFNVVAVPVAEPRRREGRRIGKKVGIVARNPQV